MTDQQDMPRLPTKPEVEQERQVERLGHEIDELREELRLTVVEKSSEIGKRLMQAKRLLAHGQWLPWLRERQMSERAAQRYMQIARKFNELGKADTTQRVAFANLSFRGALAAIQEPRDRAPSPRPRGGDPALPSAAAFERARQHLGGTEPEPEEDAGELARQLRETSVALRALASLAGAAEAGDADALRKVQNGILDLGVAYRRISDLAADLEVQGKEVEREAVRDKQEQHKAELADTLTRRVNTALSARDERKDIEDPALVDSEELRRLVKTANFHSLTDIAKKTKTSVNQLCAEIDARSLPQGRRRTLARLVAQMRRVERQPTA